MIRKSVIPKKYTCASVSIEILCCGCIVVTQVLDEKLKGEPSPHVVVAPVIVIHTGS